ncbi:hypothetical protein [Streptomyces sp. NPDC059631]|uniref:hypothetical protein n=1 Tax=unclassified Streptomyces TaxID=2593676 RepID=UPI0036868241
MTPLLSTRHSWRLFFNEVPLPPPLPSAADVVRVSMGLGMATLDTMIDSGHAVGPALCCPAHRQLLVPVRSGTLRSWMAAHSVCDAGPSVKCSPQALRATCHRFWMAPPDPLASPVTDAAMLHDGLSRMRARMLHAAQPSAWGMCRA